LVVVVWCSFALLGDAEISTELVRIRRDDVGFGPLATSRLADDG
jgi:hypothetical protein